jgi:hypothetical protein
MKVLELDSGQYDARDTTSSTPGVEHQKKWSFGDWNAAIDIKTFQGKLETVTEPANEGRTRKASQNPQAVEKTLLLDEDISERNGGEIDRCRDARENVDNG